MTRKRTLTLIVLVIGVLAAVAIAACGGESDDGSADGEEVFTIGYVADLSGAFSSYDTPIRDGAQYAIDEINAAGGINGMKLKMIVKDSKNDKVIALQQTMEMLDEEIQYLIGSCTDHTTACQRITTENEIPSDTGDGTAANLVRDAGDYAFQYVMNDALQGASLAEYAYNELGYRTAYLVSSPDVAYAEYLPGYFRQVFERLGGKIIGESTYKIEGGDFSAQVTKIQNTSPSPDCIMTAAFVPDSPVFLKQLRAAGVDIPVLTTDGNDTPDILAAGPQALDGVLLTTFAYPEEGTPLGAFYDKYEADTGSPPETVILANGYDTIMVLKAGLEASGGEGGQALRDAIANLKDVQLTTGTLTMNPETRQAERSVALLRLVGNEFTFETNLPVPEWVPEPY